jgi:aspartyl-tRNA(Asn)/glutamyl-tRNA(Gln) amidotransferase subunit C
MAMTSHVVNLENVFRKDENRPSLPNESVLSNAPEKQEGHFKVPRVI